MLTTPAALTIKRVVIQGRWKQRIPNDLRRGISRSHLQTLIAKQTIKDLARDLETDLTPRTIKEIYQLSELVVGEY